MGLFQRKTPEERAKIADTRRLQSVQYEQAQVYAKIIPAVLAKMGLASYARDKKRRVVTNRVKTIPPVVIHEDYYMVEVNTARLPYRVKIAQLMAEEILETLSGACKSKVEAFFHPGHGLWYLIPRRGGLGIIPRKIAYDAVMELMPKSDPIWTLPIGVGENKRLTRIDIRRTPHILIVGSTGAGKTVFVKNMLATLCMKCSPNRLRVVICDFKRGPDYKAFARLPHLGMPYPVKWNEKLLFEDDELVDTKEADYMNRVLYNLEDILHILKWANKEIDRRNGKFDEDITDIDRWNAKYRRRPLAHILIMIDELAVIMDQLSKAEASRLQKTLARTAMLGRSAGIHLVIGLQSLLARYLEGPVSNNIETRIVARCASGPQSGMALGNGSWSAARLPEIRGRIVWRDGMKESELQTPWVDPKKAVALIKAISAKWEEKPDNKDVEAETIFRWAIAKNNGYLGILETFAQFRGKLGKDIIGNIAKDYELTANTETGDIEPIIDLDDEQYVLLPGKPRRLITLARYRSDRAEPEAEKVDAPEVEATEPETDAFDLFRFALAELNGEFAYRTVYKKYPGEVTQTQVTEVTKKYAGKEIKIDGKRYILQKGKGRKPSKLVPCALILDPDSEKSMNLPAEGDSLGPDLAGDHAAEVIINNEDDLPDWLQGIEFGEQETRPATVIEMPEKNYQSQLDDLEV